MNIREIVTRAIDYANSVTGNQDSDLTTAMLALGDGYGMGESVSSGYAFERIPTQFDCHKKYQGWISNAIFKHNGNYAVVTYLRDGHTSTAYDTVTVFFDGYEIDRVVQCTFDGVPAHEMASSVITAWEQDGLYHCNLNKITYTSTDLVTWTTKTNTAELPGVAWEVKNINGTLYASFDNLYDTVAESTDGGATWTTVSVGTSNKKNEGDFVDADGVVFCFMGKDWARDSQTAEVGIATMCYKENGTWTQLIDTDILCNYGNCAGWYDGEYIHVLAKSRLYHNDGGDASVLRYYRATVENAKLGTFELVCRVDDGDTDGIAKYALDSTTIAVYVDSDGTGLAVSPVSASSSIMRHTYYAINSRISAELSEKHERDIANMKADYATETAYGQESPKLMYAQRADGDTSLLTYKPVSWMSNGGSQTVTDGDVASMGGFNIIGDPVNGKGLVDVTIGGYARYAYIGSGRVPSYQYSFGISETPKIFRMARDNAGLMSLPFTLPDGFRVVCSDDGESTVFYFESERYGLVRVIPYHHESALVNDWVTVVSNPYVQGRNNYGFRFKSLEYYNNVMPELPVVDAWADGVAYTIVPYKYVTNDRWATFSNNVLYEVSGFLNCKGAAELKFTATEDVQVTQRLWFYDADKKNISGALVEPFKVIAGSEKVVTVPSGAVYAVFSTNINKMEKMTVTPSATATTA